MRTFSAVPETEAGILNAGEILFTLNGNFTDGCGNIFSGLYSAKPGGIGTIITSAEGSYVLMQGAVLVPEKNTGSSFIVHSVLIGVGFHWERSEDQEFTGKLKFVNENGKLTIVNVLPIEDYLVSVISSEMSGTSSEALLKAHAVISRGWLIAQIEKRRNLSQAAAAYETYTNTGEEITRWYDREDHSLYDVCSDDHCQRYQGITRAGSSLVREAVESTWGEVLVHDGSICDTRFYKCCGGVSELFENTWEPVHHPYLVPVYDSADSKHPVPDLTSETAAREWIDSYPEVFCNTNDAKILSQVLNDYDQETHDFFRWKIRYTQQELSDLVRSRTGIDFGTVNELLPLERGASGRIKRLRIEGTLKTMVIGKELEIRKSLSVSHLYSSCFYVTRDVEEGSVVFTLHGAGWGHGAGLCQIGAAVMGAEGYSYSQILEHYFRSAILKKLYSK